MPLLSCRQLCTHTHLSGVTTHGMQWENKTCKVKRSVFWGLYFGGILISSRQTSKSFQLQSKPAFQDFNSVVIVTAPFLDYKQSLTYPASKAFVTQRPAWRNHCSQGIPHANSRENRPLGSHRVSFTRALMPRSIYYPSGKVRESGDSS